MRPAQARFITVCQQLLALGAVLAVLTPAAAVISLDVVGRAPTDASSQSRTDPSAVPHRPGAQAYRAAAGARVPTTVVDPVVREYSLTPATGARRVLGGAQARVSAGSAPGSTRIVSVPEPVTGYGAVGVSWAAGATVSDTDLGFEARTRTDGVWSDWTALEYHDDHGPDPDSAEGRHARPGTDPLLVGHVDDVQVRAELSGVEIPADMRLAVIDPGTSTLSAREAPAIDTARLSGEGSDATSGVPTEIPAEIESAVAGKATGAAMALRSTTYTPKPKIFSRAQWGADESIREKSALHYYEVHAGFVHHTVNANDYTRAEVPALLRSIYAYHVKVRGWSDIGYNFLVDRFGRIWEGRYGGVDRPVVGAHTLGYNDYSFAMSAIGNFDLVQPPGRVLRAYGALFAWKLSLHGVDASATRQVVGSTTFQAINGHRDAASTACPGRYLYAKLPKIREYAAAAQQSWSGRERVTNVADTPTPDLIVRRASDGQAFVIPTGGLSRYLDPVTLEPSWPAGTTVVATPDVTGDGRGDLAVLDAGGLLRIRPGDGQGGFGAELRASTLFRGKDLLTAAGDLDGDGNADLVARNPSTGRLNAFLGGGHGGFDRKTLGGGWNDVVLIAGAGDANGDGHADLVVKDTAGRLWLRPGTGRPGFAAPTAIAGDFATATAVSGIGDFTGDGHADLFVRSAGAGYVLPSRGDGSYGHPVGRVARARGLAGLSAADLAGSPEPDLVGRRGGALVLIRNAGTFDTRAPVSAHMNLAKANLILNVGDWDRDGYGDVVTRSSVSGSLYLHLGDGHGTFGRAIRVGTDFGDVRLLAAVGDMTGDGLPDLMGQPRGGAMRIYPGAGLSGLGPSYVAYGAIDATRQIGVGRWNADGAPDSLLRDGGTLRLYPGNGPGGLTDEVTALGGDLSAYDWVLGLGDVDLDQHADLVVRERATGYLWLLRGTPTGFKARVFLGEGFGQYDLAG